MNHRFIVFLLILNAIAALSMATIFIYSKLNFHNERQSVLLQQQFDKRVLTNDQEELRFYAKQLQNVFRSTNKSRLAALRLAETAMLFFAALTCFNSFYLGALLSKKTAEQDAAANP